MEEDGDEDGSVEDAAADDKIFKRNVQKMDNFFKEEGEAHDDAKYVEKRVLLRDGRIPKLSKNFDRDKKLAMAKEEGWDEDVRKYQQEKQEWQ